MLSPLLFPFVASSHYVRNEGFCSRNSLRILPSVDCRTKFRPQAKQISSVALKENKKNEIGKIISKVSDIITTPSDNNNFPLGCILILGLLNVMVLPLVTSLSLDVLFTIFFFFGRSVLYYDETTGDNDDDDNATSVEFVDLISLTGSFLTAGLISPQGFHHQDQSEISFVGVYVCIFIYASLIIKAIPDSDLKKEYQKFLTFGDWDKKFSKKD